MCGWIHTAVVPPTAPLTCWGRGVFGVDVAIGERSGSPLLVGEKTTTVRLPFDFVLLAACCFCCDAAAAAALLFVVECCGAAAAAAFPFRT